MRVDHATKIDVGHLCQIAGLSRASFYRRFEDRPVLEADVELLSQIQMLCLKHKYYGYRRITASLRRQGQKIGRAHV